MSINYELLLEENNKLKDKITKLEIELAETKEHLKKYTAPLRNKIYYQENKEVPANQPSILDAFNHNNHKSGCLINIVKLNSTT